MAAAASVESFPDIELSDKDHKRVQLIQRAQWLRAAILGASDGLLSVTALMLGVGAAKDDQGQGLIIIAGIAGALAGACSMAVGEFVSVSTQRDIEQTTKITTKSEAEGVKIQESTPSAIFSPPRSPFMKIVARDVREHPVKESRQDEDEEGTLPNPYKAAGASGLAFLCGSLIPILTAMAFSGNRTIRIVAVVVMASIGLAVFGGASARFGGSPVTASAVRVVVGGWISMAVTYALLMPLDRDKNDHGTTHT
ncbi:hypothetical protein ACS0TY_008710 [Phlomoides rotata]